MKGIVSSFDVLWFRNEGNVEAAAEALVAGGGHVEQVTFTLFLLEQFKKDVT